MLRLWCCVVGKDKHKPFRVTVPQSETVYYLKEAIKREQLNTFMNVDANDLMLCLVNIPLDSPDFNDKVGGVNLQDGNLRLYPFLLLSSYFEGGFSERLLHIIVKFDAPVTFAGW